MFRKYAVALLLLIAPWAIFLLAAHSTGATSTFALLLTVSVSAAGLMILIGRNKK